MSNSWGAKVLQRFDGAATQYNQAARLQTAMAWRLAGCCKRLPIPSGRWLDLGSGTGLLADAIEQRNPGRVVERIDGSPSMLARNSRPDHTQLWDLNQPLQSWDDAPTLIASSFCLHWLSDPGTRLQNWFECLAPGGWLIVALPVEGCFPQWQAAAHQAAVPCSNELKANRKPCNTDVAGLSCPLEQHIHRKYKIQGQKMLDRLMLIKHSFSA